MVRKHLLIKSNVTIFHESKEKALRAVLEVVKSGKLGPKTALIKAMDSKLSGEEIIVDDLRVFEYDSDFKQGLEDL